ncbi:BTB/POZ domain-containing protein 9-like protein [Dinothrombium tinctorium]|uniref:BTB/POZ domain-containing protein 9-like protein n=1 Tax=Dinothrombium tinctorium TaxID=1965070 RepID=A0A443RB15_9ACAR|nr:BTB/POZ domain-containing protein 9-like protein [Dinothrombium tinctorium]RWS12457.1 BTB/POZ domain-containing protein 9-like protein [Dinothrombium tinctorium]
MYRSTNTRFVDNQRLQEIVNYLLTNEHEDRDFTFVVEGREVTCHRLIVKHQSDALRKKFTEWESKKIDRITLPNVSHKVFLRLMQYLYTALFNYRGLNDSDIIELLHIAHEFDLVELCDELCSSMASRGFLNIWNVATLYKISNTYHFQKLHDECVDFMDKHANEVLMHSSLTELSSELLITLFNRDTFYVKEIEVFKALKAWLDKNGASLDNGDLRRDLLATIRLNLIPKNEFENVVKPTNLYTADEYENAVNEKTYVERVNPTIH